MTQADLAERAGLTAAAVTQIESGRSHGAERTKQALAKALGVSIAELYQEPPQASDPEVLAWNLKAAVDESGLTLKQISRLSGISLRNLTLYIDGHAYPKAVEMQALALVFKCSIDDLLKDHRPRDESEVPLPSKDIVEKPSYYDAAAILARLAAISPLRRGLVLAILFDDVSLMPDSLPHETLGPLLSTLGLAKAR